MAQAGLLIPAAEGSQVPVFRSVFADIGDEQSIAESLSTFSGHIANIVAMERALALPALVLLDEAGAGHRSGRRRRAGDGDHRALPPARRDGGRDDALRRAEVVRVDDRRGDAGRVRLRSEDVRADLSPELRLARAAAWRSRSRPGSGCRRRSSSRRARTAASARSQLAEHLAKVERDMQALEHERRLAARERETLAEAAAKLQAREQELRESRGDVQDAARRADRGAAARRAARDRRGGRRAEGADRRAGGRGGAARRRGWCRPARPARRGPRRARRSTRSASGCAAHRRRAGAGDRAGRRRAGRPRVGDRVLVGAFGLEGVVQALHDREAEVDVRGKRLRARVDELRVVTPAAASPRSRRGCGSTSTCSRATGIADRAEPDRLHTSTRRCRAPRSSSTRRW